MTSLRGQRRIRSALPLRPASSVVEEDVDHRMPAKNGTALGRLTTEFRTAASMRSRSGLFQREICEEIHKSLESDYRIGTVVDGGDMFLGEEPPLNRFGARAPTLRIVAEPDGEKKTRGRLPCNGPSRQNAAAPPAGRCRARRDNRPMPDAGAKRRRGCGSAGTVAGRKTGRDLRQLTLANTR